MRPFMFYVCSAGVGCAYLYLSAVLLFRTSLSRWVMFSIASAVAYPAASYTLFGIVPSYVEELWLWWNAAAPSLLLFLLLAGSVSCIGYGLFRHFCARQMLGLLVCFLTSLSAVGYFAGVLRPDVSIERLTTGLPFILFYIGVPGLFGWLLWQGYTLRASAGLLVVFLSGLALLSVAVTNYFGRPFGFVYELSAHTKFWIELATLGGAMLGPLLILGYGIFNRDWTWRNTVGALVVFGALMSVVLVLVQLVIGYRYVPMLFSAASH